MTTKQFAQVMAAQTRIDAANAVIRDYAGTGELKPYMKALREKHAAMVEQHELMYGEKAAATLKAQTDSSRRRHKGALVRVGWR